MYNNVEPSEAKSIEPKLIAYLFEKHPEFESCVVTIYSCGKFENLRERFNRPLDTIDYSVVYSPKNFTEFKQQLTSLWDTTNDDYKIVITTPSCSMRHNDTCSFTVNNLGKSSYNVVYKITYSDTYKETHSVQMNPLHTNPIQANPVKANPPVDKKFELLKLIVPLDELPMSLEEQVAPPNYIQAKVTNYVGSLNSNGYYFTGELYKFFNLLTNNGEKRYEGKEIRWYRDWNAMEEKTEDPVKLSEQDKRKYKLKETDIVLPWVVMDQAGVPVIDVEGKKIPNFEIKVVKKDKTIVGQFKKSVMQKSKWFKTAGKRNTRRGKRNARRGTTKKVYKKHRHQHTRKRKLS